MFTLLGTPFQGRQLALPDIPFQVLRTDGGDPALRSAERSGSEGTVSVAATVEYMKGMAALLCQEVPSILKAEAIDAVLADQEEPGAATAADLAGLPYVSICNSLPLNAAVEIPPGFFDWPYSPGLWAKLRNRCAYSIRNTIMRGVFRILNAYRRPAALMPYRRPDDSFSRRGQITQLVRDFDFPHRNVPKGFHYVGPFQRSALSNVEFPYHRLDSRPIVYVSFGTSFGNCLTEMRAIASACASLPIQLVITLGGIEPGPEHNAFPGSPVVVRYAPQRELLRKSALVITHAGLNTTLEALSFGVPLLAMPMAGDQPGVAARLVYHNAGLTLSKKQRSPEAIGKAISALLADSGYRDAASRLQTAISATGGAAEAARIIEAAITG